MNREHFTFEKSVRLNVANETREEQVVEVSWALRNAKAQVLRDGGTKELRVPALTSVWLDKVMLPDVDGFKLCLMIRKEHYFPIIMLMARVEDVDKINGLMLGADDYITKPFNPLEVVARVKTQLRRYRSYNSKGMQGKDGLGSWPEEELEIRGLWMSRRTHQSALFGKELELTPREFSILWYLCSHQGQVVSSEELFEAVWKEKYLDNNNTVMAHIGRIREKMRDSYRNQKFIKTVWGVGYTIER